MTRASSQCSPGISPEQYRYCFSFEALFRQPGDFEGLSAIKVLLAAPDLAVIHSPHLGHLHLNRSTANGGGPTEMRPNEHPVGMGEQLDRVDVQVRVGVDPPLELRADRFEATVDGRV